MGGLGGLDGLWSLEMLGWMTGRALGMSLGVLGRMRRVLLGMRGGAVAGTCTEDNFIGTCGVEVLCDAVYFGKEKLIDIMHHF